MQIRVFLAGVEFGPYTEEKVYRLLDEGTLSLSDLAKHDESEDWTRLELVLIQVNAAVEAARKAGVPERRVTTADLPKIAPEPVPEKKPDTVLVPVPETAKHSEPEKVEVSEVPVASAPETPVEIPSPAPQPSFFSQPGKDEKKTASTAPAKTPLESRPAAQAELTPIIDMTGSFRPGKKKNKPPVNLTTLSGRLKALTTTVPIKQKPALAPPQTHLFPAPEALEVEEKPVEPVKSLPPPLDLKPVVPEPEIKIPELKPIVVPPPLVSTPLFEIAPTVPAIAPIVTAKKDPVVVAEPPVVIPTIPEKFKATAKVPELPIAKTKAAAPSAASGKLGKAPEPVSAKVPETVDPKPARETSSIPLPPVEAKVIEKAPEVPPAAPIALEKAAIKKPDFLEPIKPAESPLEVAREVVVEPVREAPPLPVLSAVGLSRPTKDTTSVVPSNLMPRTPIKGTGEKTRTQVPVARKLTEVARPAPLEEPAVVEKRPAKRASIFPRSEKETAEVIDIPAPEIKPSVEPLAVVEESESREVVATPEPMEGISEAEYEEIVAAKAPKVEAFRSGDTAVIEELVAKPEEVKKSEKPPTPPPSKRIEINLTSRKVPTPAPVQIEVPVVPVTVEEVEHDSPAPGSPPLSPKDFPIMGTPPSPRRSLRKQFGAKLWARRWQSWMIYSVFILPVLVIVFLLSPTGTRWIQRSSLETTPASTLPAPKWAKTPDDIPPPAPVVTPAPVAPKPTPIVIPAAPTPVIPNATAARSAQLVSEGMEKFQKGDLQGAVTDYNQALEINPKSSAAYLNRGLAKGSQSDLDGAIADYTQALQIEPKLALASYNRGLARQVKNDLNGALTDYTEALQSDPKLALGYYYRGLIEEQQGNLDAAINDSTKSIELDPGYAQAFYNRGLARLAKNNVNGALADLQQFTTLNTRDVYADYAHVYIWIIQSQQNQLAEANQDLSAALQSGWNADGSELVSKIAQLLLGQISESELISAAGSPDALKDQEQRCEAWYFIGMKRLQAGDKIAATSAFQKCVATQETDYCEYILAQEQLRKLIPVNPGR